VDFLLGNEELPLEEIKSWVQRVNTTSDCDVQQKIENWYHGGGESIYHVMRLESGVPAALRTRKSVKTAPRLNTKVFLGLEEDIKPVEAGAGRDSRRHVLIL
jgi:hypothetical protein